MALNVRFARERLKVIQSVKANVSYEEQVINGNVFERTDKKTTDISLQTI